MRLHALPARVDNYIWVLRNAAGRALVVDPSDAAPVLEAANESDFTPAALLLTHHHGDHIGGAPSLLSHWPQLRAFGPDDARIELPMTPVGDGAVFDVEGWRIRGMHVPGHTRSHVAFLVEDAAEAGAPVLFCGDTLFSLGCGRLFEGDAAQMHASLTRLAALPRDTQVCCGHEYTLANAAFAAAVEPDNAALARRTEEARSMRDARRPTLPSTIGDEIDCNPFLRCESPQVIAAAATRLGRAPVDAIETFATLRSWKDGFRS